MKRIIPFFGLLLITILILSFRISSVSNLENDCMKCHEDILNNKVIHPITETGCQYCHESNGEKHPGNESGFKLTAEYPDMCYMCHDDKNRMAHVHSPVSEGDCSVCHSPHSAPNQSLILDFFSENPCLDCHYIETEEARTVHGPVMDGKCLNCHDVHQSENTYQLRKETNELCLSCHNKKIVTIDKEIRSISESLKKGNQVHGPIKKESCMTCHSPHSTDNSFLLVGAYPIKQYAEATVENFGLCFQCHDSKILTEDSTTSVTNFRNGSTNLHYLHIRGNRGRNCNLCHNAHGAPNKHMLEEEVLFGKWLMPMGLELTENGGSCATGCHKRLEYSRTVVMNE